MSTGKRKIIARDISWLSFNARVLQEAADPTVPLNERIRFLGIFSNNLDEFFRVRVATLKRMMLIKPGKINMHLENKPADIIRRIQSINLDQQKQFDKVWKDILREMRKENIQLVTETQLNKEQQKFVRSYFEEEVEANIVPLMVEDLKELPYLREKSIYLAVAMAKSKHPSVKRYTLIEVPARQTPRFILLPSKKSAYRIILLEDVIRFCLPQIFSFMGYDQFSAHIIKFTRDAEIDIDNDLTTSLVQKIEKGIKNRKKGRPVRFIYDKEIDKGLLDFLVKKFNLLKKDEIVGGGRIHNFRHFMDFPQQVFRKKNIRKQPFIHPQLLNATRYTDVVLQKDILLNPPYHSFDPIIELLREAAFDPQVSDIKITCYRLAPYSKIINALINAKRNGKQVTVMLELRARFDEEANLEWKERLEEEGVKVLIGVPNMKVHAKLCVIRKKQNKKNILYGFVGTGNLNERTAKIYGDHFLLTANRSVMQDAERIFSYLENPKKNTAKLRACRKLLVCPVNMRRSLYQQIDNEIKQARKGKPASITVKINSLSDHDLILRLYNAAKAGVELKMIVRGIFCFYSGNTKFKAPVKAVSIVDEYLEHARVLIFHNGGKQKVYLSSADWMIRNLDHRVEAAVEITDKELKQELIDILNIQLADNIKARILDDELSNQYVSPAGNKKVRSQIEIYNYLYKKYQQALNETGGDRHRK